MMGICQLMKFIYLQFIVILAVSCGSVQKINLNRPVETLPAWFKTDENFALREKDGAYIVHPFFDSKHHLDEDSKGVNFILVTPEESEFRYFLDLMSGSLVVDKKYCEQEDVWKRSSDTLDRPPFNIGVIPRWLDAYGMPQEVLVFGRGSFYRDQPKKFSKTFRARVVGGVNVQYCPKKLCRADDWISNIVPVAVDPQDSKFEETNTIDDLKGEVDWDEVILFLQNGKGRILRANKDLPSYRLLSEISSKSTIKYLSNKSYEFKYDKMMKMRNACHQLYRYIWGSTIKLRKFKKKSDQKIIQEFKVKFFERNVYTKEKIKTEEEIYFDSSNFSSFARWFEEFYLKLGNDFKTCSKYTRMGNFSVNRDQFWFFVYFDLFFKMQDVGLVYNCSSNSWIKNFRDTRGEWVYSQHEFLGQCTPSSLDRAFETAASYMLDLQKNDLEHFRFIGYDSSLGGSHQRVYNWVNFSGKKFRCIDVDEERENNEMISRLIFDGMTPWRRFSPKSKGRYDLIY